jgi:acetyltransferase-like isoleucine patch superfamily enzyme
MYKICNALRISIGHNCRFFGLTKMSAIKADSISIGSNCRFHSKSTKNLIGINRPCILSTNTVEAKLKIGNNCGFSGTVVGCFINIEIGNNVRCGANTTITDSDWHNSDSRVGAPRSIVIKDNVWLGLNVIVMKGVTIGENTIIGAGSVVVNDIPENVIAAGNPCKVLKSLL